MPWNGYLIIGYKEVDDCLGYDESIQHCDTLEQALHIIKHDRMNIPNGEYELYKARKIDFKEEE